jgi:two-component system, NarL family, response regulator DevR
VKVLLVDDAASVRSRLGAMLAEIPGVAIVIEAESAAEAAEALGAIAPEIVVLDLHLGPESGMSLLSLVKRNRPTALLIVMTNHPTERHRRWCMMLGADYFFDKSKDFEDVLRVVAATAAPTWRVETSDA